MEAVRICETSLFFNETTRRRRENMIFHTYKIILLAHSAMLETSGNMEAVYGIRSDVSSRSNHSAVICNDLRHTASAGTCMI